MPMLDSHQTWAYYAPPIARASATLSNETITNADVSWKSQVTQSPIRLDAVRIAIFRVDAKLPPRRQCWQRRAIQLCFFTRYLR